MSIRQRVVILGSSFAGLTAALELRRRVGDRHEIVVLDPRPRFTCIPSLIWLPFGQHRDVFAAGVAIAIAPPEPTPVPAGVPKTGQMTETMAKVAAHNIADDLECSGRDRLPLEDLGAVCILDAGNSGVIFKASHVLAHNGTGNGKVASAHLSAGPHAHWAKLAFEHIYLASRKRGALVL